MQLFAGKPRQLVQKNDIIPSFYWNSIFIDLSVVISASAETLLDF